MNLRSSLHILLTGMFVLLITACGKQSTFPTKELDEIGELRQRAADVPELPFPDNPDPEQCGIPVKWGKEDPAWLSGYYEGNLVEPTVYLYDSHLRYEITGEAPSGTAIRILLYQHNPTLDFYMVETIAPTPKQTGWVPAPFILFQN